MLNLQLRLAGQNSNISPNGEDVVRECMHVDGQRKLDTRPVRLMQARVSDGLEQLAVVMGGGWQKKKKKKKEERKQKEARGRKEG